MLPYTDDSGTQIQKEGRAASGGRTLAPKVWFAPCPTVPWLCDLVPLFSPEGREKSGACLRGLSGGMKG